MTPPLNGRADQEVLIVGVSTRALAESALVSGYTPHAVDFYGDRDHKRHSRNVALGRDLGLEYSAGAAARVAAGLDVGRVAYAADFENDPAAVRELARGRELLGNPPEVLAAVRNPELLFRVFDDAGFPTPRTVFGPAQAGRARERTTHRGPPEASANARWLRKPRAGGGGRGIGLIMAPAALTDGEMLQEHIPGPCLSFLFVADGRRVRPLGLNTQIEDRKTFGAAPFAYCGSVTGVPVDLEETSIREQALALARVATVAFTLRGWNGLDFMIRRGEVVPLEINPRYTSTMELWDGSESRLFAAHAQGCRGAISEESWLPEHRDVRGKAILFAKLPVTVRPASIWNEALACRSFDVWPTTAIADIPHPGDRIERGQPICTLFAAAPSAGSCIDRLRSLAGRIERELYDSPASGSADLLRATVTSSTEARPAAQVDNREAEPLIERSARRA